MTRGAVIGVTYPVSFPLISAYCLAKPIVRGTCDMIGQTMMGAALIAEKLAKRELDPFLKSFSDKKQARDFDDFVKSFANKTNEILVKLEKPSPQQTVPPEVKKEPVPEQLFPRRAELSSEKPINEVIDPIPEKQTLDQSEPEFVSVENMKTV